jgi:hypothetical protein
MNGILKDWDLLTNVIISLVGVGLVGILTFMGTSVKHNKEEISDLRVYVVEEDKNLEVKMAVQQKATLETLGAIQSSVAVIQNDVKHIRNHEDE